MIAQHLAAMTRPIVVLSYPVLTETEALLKRPRWKRQHEQVVYWAGIETKGRWIVTTVIAPEAVTTRGSYVVSSLSNAKVISHLSKLSLSLLAQIHTHPGEFVGHSYGDNQGTLTPYENLLSLVIADYCRSGLLPLTDCGVHRFEQSAFRRLTAQEITALFQIVPVKLNLRR
jgi:hypothetical protein